MRQYIDRGHLGFSRWLFMHTGAERKLCDKTASAPGARVGENLPCSIKVMPEKHRHDRAHGQEGKGILLPDYRKEDAMKLRRKEIVIIIVFAVLSVASLAGVGIYYYNYYQDMHKSKQILEAAEKSQKNVEEEKKKEAEKKAELEEKKRKRLARIEEAKGLVITAYTEFLQEYRGSADYSAESDRYFIYDVNSDGVPELFITTPSQDSTFLRDYSFYKFGLSSKEVEQIEVSAEPVLSFFTGNKGIFTYSRKSDGTTLYSRYRFAGGELKRTDIGSFMYQWEEQKCYIDGEETEPADYATKEENFHQKFIKDHVEIQEYAMEDTTPLDAYVPEGNVNESSAIPAGNAINNKYDGKLLFHPEDVTDMGDYYQVTGELWQSFYVSEEDVENSLVGESIDINGSLYTITEIGEDGTVYLGEDGLCLKKDFTGSENYIFYGKAPAKCYEVFRTDTGRPYHETIATPITLFFSRSAFVTEILVNEYGESIHALTSAENFLATDYYGNLLQGDSYGYIRLENGMIYSYNELP